MINPEDLKVGDIIYLREDQNPEWDSSFVRDLHDKNVIVTEILDMGYIKFHTLETFSPRKYTGHKISIYEQCWKLDTSTISRNRFDLIFGED